MMSSPRTFQTEIIEQAMSVDALKFGSFTLNSGRISPYFFNAGFLASGSILSTVAEAYAETLAEALRDPDTPLPPFDVLFGPVYKGIAFAAATAVALHTTHSIPAGFAYARREVKEHGEGGVLVGVPINGKRVVILDDVMTSGKAVREAIDIVQRAGGEVVGVVLALDRQEVGLDGKSSTVAEIEGIVGKGMVRSILKLKDVLEWLENKGMREELESMRQYWAKYGLK